MAPQPGNALEVNGVLNPAAARGPDGHLYLFPRLVAQGNYSRIGIVRVKFDASGSPTGVDRLGIALEPEAEYEIRQGGGGCEDPRVSFVEPLGHYVMTYTALSPKGPRIALAVSNDLFHWKRLGLVTFEPYEGIEFDGVDNKDASVFPVAIPDPSGKPALALLHRPLFPGTRPEEKASNLEYTVQDRHRESIWLSYRDISIDSDEACQVKHFTSHHRLAAPEASWEMLKIGCGTPPILTQHGWMLIYHGVSEVNGKICYSAGVMILDKDDPCKILYRSPAPLLTPQESQERLGVISDVVFPTGIDRRSDLGLSDRFNVYYGMADDMIGVIRLSVPEQLPTTASLDKRVNLL